MKNISVSVLNSLLLQELAAVKTYKSALFRFPEADFAQELQELYEAHVRRATLLESRICELGGIPATAGSGWGMLAKNDVVLGAQTAVCVFKEGEETALDNYRASLTELENLDDKTQTLLLQELIPEQELTVSVVTTWHDAVAEFGAPVKLAS